MANPYEHYFPDKIREKHCEHGLENIHRSYQK